MVRLFILTVGNILDSAFSAENSRVRRGKNAKVRGGKNRGGDKTTLLRTWYAKSDRKQLENSWLNDILVSSTARPWYDTLTFPNVNKILHPKLHVQVKIVPCIVSNRDEWGIDPHSDPHHAQYTHQMQATIYADVELWEVGNLFLFNFEYDVKQFSPVFSSQITRSAIRWLQKYPFTTIKQRRPANY